MVEATGVDRVSIVMVRRSSDSSTVGHRRAQLLLGFRLAHAFASDRTKWPEHRTRHFPRLSQNSGDLALRTCLPIAAGSKLHLSRLHFESHIATDGEVSLRTSAIRAIVQAAISSESLSDLPADSFRTAGKGIASICCWRLVASHDFAKTFEGIKGIPPVGIAFDQLCLNWFATIALIFSIQCARQS